jgi:hypothetical protein
MAETKGSIVCARCREALPERWNGARCRPLAPVGGSEVWFVVMAEEGQPEWRRPVYLCVPCTESLRQWFEGEATAASVQKVCPACERPIALDGETCGDPRCEQVHEAVKRRNAQET